MKDKTVEDVEHKNEDKMKTFSGALDPRHCQKLGFCGIMIWNWQFLDWNRWNRCSECPSYCQVNATLLRKYIWKLKVIQQPRFMNIYKNFLFFNHHFMFTSLKQWKAVQNANNYACKHLHICSTCLFICSPFVLYNWAVNFKQHSCAFQTDGKIALKLSNCFLSLYCIRICR